METLSPGVSAIYVIVIAQGAVCTAITAWWALRLTRRLNGALAMMIAGMALMMGTVTVEASVYGGSRFFGSAAYIAVGYSPWFVAATKGAYVVAMAMHLAALRRYLSGRRAAGGLVVRQSIAAAVLYAAAYAALSWWRR